jgi:8-oxo-dGTP pyrophosphatase MutT (NUDIX family)
VGRGRVERPAVRVLLVDPDERLLLFRALDAARGVSFWFPPGGGLTAGESHVAAARRELVEETGLALDSLGPEVWRRRHAYSWRGVDYDQRERWFVCHVDAFTPLPAGLSPEEAEDLREWRWWTTADRAATPDELVPRALPSLYAALLRDGPPAAPIEVGA